MEIFITPRFSYAPAETVGLIGRLDKDKTAPLARWSALGRNRIGSRMVACDERRMSIAGNARRFKISTVAAAVRDATTGSWPDREACDAVISS